MEQIYNLQMRGKILFYIAAFICFISLIGIPVGILFIIMAYRAKIVILDDAVVYTMLFTKTICYKDITKIMLAKPVSPRLYMGNAAPGVFINVVTVVPLIIESKDKKIKFSANFFDNSEEVVSIILKKTKLKLETRT
ncbi:hypothetical protein HZA96_02590 [Candidatus Woesearchaeota archaeon]|nr:hypothetical protein [Candidatus Woesearchaeota archaeon]